MDLRIKRNLRDIFFKWIRLNHSVQAGTVGQYIIFLKNTGSDKMRSVVALGGRRRLIGSGLVDRLPASDQVLFFTQVFIQRGLALG